MTDWPLRSLKVADFRRLGGFRRIPLDAPIVLIHGSNGSGKTSVLSALEMALTGRVGSMERQDPRYTAHLPHTGQDFATVQVEVADHIRPTPMDRMTVGGSRVAGTPALDREKARFFSERCYLDQSSLGRLLELYQTREGKQETLLAKFINELLGLEQLDALRAGLNDANNLRALKKLAPRLEEGDDVAKRAANDVTAAADKRDAVSRELEAVRAQVAILLGSAGTPVTAGMTIGDVLELARNSVPQIEPTLPRALDIDRKLAVLQGRIEAAADRPSTHRQTEARAILETATARLNNWKQNRQPAYLTWLDETKRLGVDMSLGPVTGLTRALSAATHELDAQQQMRETRAELTAGLDRDRQNLTQIEDQLTSAQADATALVEGLAALRGLIETDTCPVCDRDFSEVKKGHLDAYVDGKISQLADQGDELIDLRTRRDRLAAAVQQRERELQSLDAKLLDGVRIADLDRRLVALQSQQMAYANLQAVVAEGSTLFAAEREARQRLEELDAAATEYDRIDGEIAQFAAQLDATIGADEGTTAAGNRLAAISAEAIQTIRLRDNLRRSLADAARRLQQANVDHENATVRVAEVVQDSHVANERMTEARRRQRVARDVHDAAGEARTTIVQQVFTESLNNVWADLFKRLAPQEKFIPAFGIPSATKTTLEVVLETRLGDGEAGGPPEMMLSAGNLNTAALSLFLALHLAVEPMMRCLVFDDPVQAMDEIHVAQFAALIRSLSKHHERQVVIAVHERELFNYLALELSPAYDGDSLITVELGERANESDGGVTRINYRSDAAIIG